MRRPWLALACALTTGCGDDTQQPDPDPEPQVGWESCQASDAAFVRRAITIVLGRPPRSQGEVNAYLAVMKDTTAKSDVASAKRQLVRLLARNPAYAPRWTEFLFDALKVPRLVEQRTATYDLSAVGCFGKSAAQIEIEGGVRGVGPDLAGYVRDNPPSADASPLYYFTMAELTSSSVQLDDLSPLLRANAIHLLNFAVAGANVEPEELEISRRVGLARAFEESYLNRNRTCLPCHNSEFSVTYSPEPEENRTWAIGIPLERTVYGDPSAQALPELTYASIFRVDGVADPEGNLPWGWAEACGRFQSPSTNDPLEVDAQFGSVRSSPQDPTRGLRSSVWNLEAALRRGFERVRGTALPVGSPEIDPDDALVYLVAMTMSDRIWAEITGHSLTIANYFPRTEAQREVLTRLANAFIAGGYSVRATVEEALLDPVFNLALPDAACWEKPYPIPRVLDPWTNGETDPERRLNGPSDRVAFRTSRTMLRMAHEAMSWPPPVSFPENEDLAFQVGIGMFTTPSDPGFLGLDFQGRLVWEDRTADCAPQVTGDFIDRLLEHTAGGATLEAMVPVLRDRLLADPMVDDAERVALEALVGAPLASVAGPDAGPALRAICGAYLDSPLFQLDGIVADDEMEEPEWTLPADGQDAICAELEERAGAIGETIVCSSN